MTQEVEALWLLPLWCALFYSAVFILNRFMLFTVWLDIFIPVSSPNMSFLMNLWSYLKPCVGPLSHYCKSKWFSLILRSSSVSSSACLLGPYTDLPFGSLQTSAFVGFLSFALSFKAGIIQTRCVCLRESKCFLCSLKVKPRPLSACQFVLVAQFTHSLRIAHSSVVFAQLNWPRVNLKIFLFFYWWENKRFSCDRYYKTSSTYRTSFCLFHLLLGGGSEGVQFQCPLPSLPLVIISAFA